MTHNLVVNYGLYRKMDIFRPKIVSAAQLTRFHSDDYINFLHMISPGEFLFYEITSLTLWLKIIWEIMSDNFRDSMSERIVQSSMVCLSIARSTPRARSEERFVSIKMPQTSPSTGRVIIHIKYSS